LEVAVLEEQLHLVLLEVKVAHLQFLGLHLLVVVVVALIHQMLQEQMEVLVVVVYLKH